MSIKPVDTTVELMSFAREFGQLLRAVETAAAGGGVGPAEGRVLRTLGQRRMTSAALGRELGLDSGQLTRLTHSLEAKGLIERSEGVKLRGRTWAVTPSGHRKVSALVSEHRAAAAEVFREDQQFFARFLASVQKLGDHSYALHNLEPLIREAAVGETGELVNMAARSFVNGFFGFDRTFVSHLHDVFAEALASEHIALVAEHQRILVGGLVLTIDRRARTGSIPFFAMFFPYQGLGWGGLLLDPVIKRARQLDLKRLTIEIPMHTDNDSYFRKFREWKNESSKPATLCGAKVRLERWSTELT
jgi:DNA-binding MarR family transcriptional regulator